MLKQELDLVHPLSNEHYELFISTCKAISYKRKEIVLQEGEICKGVFFIKRGLLAIYELKDDKEIYTDFFFENEVASEVSSLAEQKPSRQFMTALEETEVLFCARERLLALYQQAPDFQEFGRKVLEKLLIKKTNYSSILSSLSAKEKYEYIILENPKLAQRIPLQYLSSYLGISRETLSRIRKST